METDQQPQNVSHHTSLHSNHGDTSNHSDISNHGDVLGHLTTPNLRELSEEEQIRMALQMSMVEAKGGIEFWIFIVFAVSLCYINIYEGA